MGLDYFSRYSYLLRISLDDMLLFAEVAIYKMPYIKKKKYPNRAILFCELYIRHTDGIYAQICFPVITVIFISIKRSRSPLTESQWPKIKTIF